MPTLYVENVPDDLYTALRERARSRRKSIAAEVLALLEENVPTREELVRRKEFFRRVRRIHARSSPAVGPFPNSEEMQREDRAR
jgi:plasmid stability protein